MLLRFTQWLEATAGETVRQIEERVGGRRPGDRPTDPKAPELRRRVVRLELGPEAFALWVEAIDRDPEVVLHCAGSATGVSSFSADTRASALGLGSGSARPLHRQR